MAATSPLSVSILGAGAWGTTLAILAAEAGHDVSLVAHRAAVAEFIALRRSHPTSLPGVDIPDRIHPEHTGNHSLASSDVVIVAVPTQRLGAAVEPLAAALRGKPVVSAAKGLELDTLERPSSVIRTRLGPDALVAALSGPNLSAEIAAGHPATTVIAGPTLEDAERLVPLLHSHRFRVYVSDDMVGVELGGALKNIIAIGAGIADGLGAGDNAKAAFLTRGIAEITRLGVAAGAQPLTFAGLSGIGDLIATCASPHSRNHQVGVALATGASLDAVLAGMSEVAEGVPTTRAAVQLGRRYGVELPIIEQMHRVLFEGVSPTEAIVRLMERDPRRESLDLGL